ncbi:Uncharacterised protein [Bordetella pertussis]|nr:Uncharacterised protein [Bordetella pertussis]
MCGTSMGRLRVSDRGWERGPVSRARSAILAAGPDRAQDSPPPALRNRHGRRVPGRARRVSTICPDMIDGG